MKILELGYEARPTIVFALLIRFSYLHYINWSKRELLFNYLCCLLSGGIAMQTSINKAYTAKGNFIHRIIHPHISVTKLIEQCRRSTLLALPNITTVVNSIHQTPANLNA